MKKTYKDKLKIKFNLKKFLFSIVLLVILAEIGFYGYTFIGKQKEVKDLKQKIEKLNISISTMKRMKLNNKISDHEKKFYLKEFGNKKYEFGAETGNVILFKKISKLGVSKSYIEGRVDFYADSIESLKLLLLTLYLNTNVYKITNINLDTGEIELILKGLD